MKCCVTGGLGMIATSLVKRLLKDGHEVTVLDNQSHSLFFSIQDWIKYISKEGQAKILVGNILDEDEDVFDGIDIVFHLAALTSVARSWQDIQGYEEVNSLGTLNVLEKAKWAGVKRIVYASTAAIYGSQEQAARLRWGALAAQGTLPYPRTEKDLCQPLSPYAASKLHGEHFCQLQGDQAVPYTILRFFNIFGPDQKFRVNDSYASVIPTFIRKALNQEPPTIYGDGRQTRDFIYVKDVVEACVGLAQDERARGEIYNIGSGKSCSVLVLWEMIKEFSRRNLNPVYGQPRLGEIRDNLADIRKVQEVLGKEWPKYSLKDALWETFLEFQTGGETQ